MSNRIETTVVKVGYSKLFDEPDEKAIERKITEMGQMGWMLIQRAEQAGYTRFDRHTRLTFQRFAS